jgi:23S rRNA pseudouridine1911/1915/1917 synthase
VTLLDRLRALHPEASGRSLRQWLTHGRVSVNGRVARDGRAPVAAGDRVTLGSRGAGRSPARPALPAGISLVHEDDAILVVDKPAGLLTIATDRERERTAYRLVWDYLAARRPPRRPFVVHRLDRDTSGLIVFAKSPAAKRALQAQFAARSAERRYVAVVAGRVRSSSGTLETRLVQDERLRVRSGPEGREAITRYRVLGRRGDTTVLELELGTGRRRQIRVQLAELGHPILGDRDHGGRRDPSGRLALHACRLGFTHPATGQPVRFESAAPVGWV